MEAHRGLCSNENVIQSIVFAFTVHVTMHFWCHNEKENTIHVLAWAIYDHIRMKMNENLFDI